MTPVILKPLFHRNQECIGIYYENYPSLNTIIRKLAGAKWSQTNKCWYTPLSKENYNKLYLSLKGKANIEQGELHKYLADKKKKPDNLPIVQQNSKPVNDALKKIVKSNNNLVQRSGVIYKTGVIHPVNGHIIPAMQQQLKLKAYSTSTIKTYTNEMGGLLHILKSIPADELNPEQLKRQFVKKPLLSQIYTQCE